MQELTLGCYSGNILLSRVVDGILLSVTKYDTNNFNNTIHYHHNTHLSFTLDGGCVEQKRNSYEIMPGHLTYYSAGEVHQVVKVAKPTRRVNLEIEPAFFERFGITDEIAREAVTANPKVKLLMAKVSKELIINDGLSDITIQMLLLDLLDRSRVYLQEKAPGWVQVVRDYLYSHSDQQTTLDNLSLISGLHPVTISKIFPKYFSCTVGEYKRNLKLVRALEVIKTREFSLAQTAYECGFFDQSHFIRAFKKMTGFLPTDYQKL
jgi:AraC family transcriptional regulator